MTTVFAIALPFLAAFLAVTARRRFGAWAGWLVFLLWAFAYGRLLADELWWGEPDLWFEGLDDAVGAFAAAMVMGLILHSLPPKRPRFFLQVAIVGVAGLLVQWAGSQPPVLPPPIDKTLKAYDGNLIVSVLGLWMVGLLLRDFRRWRRARSEGKELRREA